MPAQCRKAQTVMRTMNCQNKVLPNVSRILTTVGHFVLPDESSVKSTASSDI